MAKKSRDGGPSRMALVREALGELGMDAKPDALREHILAKHQIDIPKQQISTYKSLIKKESTDGKLRRVAKDTTHDSAPTHSSSHKGGDPLIEFVGTVREFEGKLGAAKILEVMNALYKGK